MTRPYLIDAREKNDLTQQELANFVQTSRSMISAWENGTRNPEPFQRRRLREILHRPVDEYEHLFELDTDSTPRGIAYIMDIIRRQFIEKAAKTVLAGYTLALVPEPVVEPQEYLRQASLHLDDAEMHLYSGNPARTQLILDSHLSTLKRFATAVTPYQSLAATLTIRALIFKMLLANNNRLFNERELLAIESIKYAVLSSDPTLVALANFWYGDTYVYCYHKPEQAIPLLNAAMQNTNKGTSPLVRSQVAINLAIANGQAGDEKGVLENIQIAYDSIPTTPEQDPYWNYTRIGRTEIQQMEGKAYIELARNMPSYGQTAYDKMSTSLQSVPSTKGYHIQALTRKAEASKVVGDLKTLVVALYESLGMATNYNRLAQIHEVAFNVPDQWIKEQSVQKLQKDVSHALMIVQR